jgi:hypothetical protein
MGTEEIRHPGSKKLSQVIFRAALVVIALSLAVCQAEPSRMPVSPKASADEQSGLVPAKKTRPGARWHRVQVSPRAGVPAIHCYDKINPVWWVKNSDEPVPPEWYRPHERRRVIKWRFRNPFHNFSSYVIGIADKKFVRNGRYPEVTSNPNGGWNFAISKYKWLRLPFIDYRRGRFESYVGWRDHGNFGVKANII